MHLSVPYGDAVKIACLPWYDLAEIEPANDALWEKLAAGLRREGLEGVPDSLERRFHHQVLWSDPDFFLGQACGYDVLFDPDHRLQIVATPCYRVPDCAPGEYTSAIIVRATSNARTLEDLRGARAVINSPTSHSGMNVLGALIAPLAETDRFLESCAESGAHELSIQCVREGEADLAAVDCVTLELLRAHRPAALEGIRVLAITPAAAAPPLVTRRDLPAEELAILRRVLSDVIADPAISWARSTLLLEGFVQRPLAAYASIEEMARIAAPADLPARARVA